MKKISLLLLVLTICFFTACHKNIWAELDELDQRVTRLEELCKEMNTNIISIQTIVNVNQSGDYITGIVEIKKDGKVIGYTITFGKHDPITIYHGEDGKDGNNGLNGSSSTPVIGVAQDTDGVYYWTLNGEWLLDNNGNKIAVSDITSGSNGSDGEDGSDGTTGKDGITPQLKIEEGYWYVSYDNGKTWTQLGQATGEDGEKGDKGDKGDSMFQSVTQDENYVYFTLADGTVIKIAKGIGNNEQVNVHDIIDFKDLAVKSALLKLGVDTTGDGEVSFAEAEKFSGEIDLTNNVIHSFKELEYFKSISSYSFFGCKSLFEVKLPNHLTYVGTSSSLNNGSFEHCESLSSIIIPEGVTNISAETFKLCESLYSISIPSTITEIGSEAFYECSSLKSIVIPASVQKIGACAFQLAGINNLIWNAKTCTIETPDNINYNANPLCVNPMIVVFGDSVQDIPTQLCKNAKITSVVIPENVLSIGSAAFRGCASLVSITIEEGMKEIGSGAFYECTSLKSISIPNSTTILSGNAFYGCSSLTSVTIGLGIQKIGEKAFYLCHKLQYLYCKALTPPILGQYALPDKIGIIYVPRSSVSEYKALWSDYANKIVGYDFE